MFQANDGIKTRPSLLLFDIMKLVTFYNHKTVVQEVL